MKASELIRELQDEVAEFGDVEIGVFCPIHGCDGEPTSASGLGWWGDGTERMTIIECVLCHQEGIWEKAVKHEDE